MKEHRLNIQIIFNGEEYLVWAEYTDYKGNSLAFDNKRIVFRDFFGSQEDALEVVSKWAKAKRREF